MRDQRLRGGGDGLGHACLLGELSRARACSSMRAVRRVDDVVQAARHRLGRLAVEPCEQGGVELTVLARHRLHDGHAALGEGHEHRPAIVGVRHPVHEARGDKRVDQPRHVAGCHLQRVGEVDLRRGTVVMQHPQHMRARGGQPDASRARAPGRPGGARWSRAADPERVYANIVNMLHHVRRCVLRRPRSTTAGSSATTRRWSGGGRRRVGDDPRSCARAAAQGQAQPGTPEVSAAARRRPRKTHGDP